MSDERFWSPLQLRTARESVRDRLTDWIVAGELAAGSQPTIHRLAESLGTSATPVREALFDLSVRGLVDALPNRGFRVRDLSADEVDEIYPLIALLEVEGLRSSPPGKDRLTVLREINEEFRRSASRPLESVRQDAAWHEELLGECRNATLLRYLHELRTRAWRYEVAYLSDGGRSRRSAELHDRIVAAIESGDLEAASISLRDNWMDGPRYLLRWIESQRPGA